MGKLIRVSISIVDKPRARHQTFTECASLLVCYIIQPTNNLSIRTDILTEQKFVNK